MRLILTTLFSFFLLVHAFGQEHKYELMLSTGINSGYFFDQRPLRMSNINNVGIKNGVLKTYPVNTNTFVQSLELGILNTNTHFGLLVSFQEFFSARFVTPPPPKNDQFIKDVRDNLSLQLFYKKYIFPKLDLMASVGLGYRNTYNKYASRNGYVIANTFTQELSKDAASVVATKLQYHLPYHFSLGAKLTYYYAFYRQNIELNTPHDLFLSASLGYTFNIKQRKRTD